MMTQEHTDNAGVTLVLGMGVTGLSAAGYLARCGVRAMFADTRDLPPARGRIESLFPDAEFSLGGWPDPLPDDIDCIIASPGIRLDMPLIGQARERGVPVVSDIDLFVRESELPRILVTGSNGKSTVTRMVEAVLTYAGRRVSAGGNLGTAALDLLPEPADVVVLELSSFQLERSGPIPAEAAVLLNIGVDHLDQHGDMDSYLAAKQRIYSDCKTAIVNRDDPALSGSESGSANVTSFGLGEPGSDDWGVREHDGEAWLAHGNELLMPAAEIALPGAHNVANALATAALCSAVGVEFSAIRGALASFVGLEHRMQRVPTDDGIVWINDSKATNVAAALASIRSVEDPFVLVAGGDAKGAAFDELAAELADRDCQVVLLGRDARLIADAIGTRAPTHLARDMFAAVACARELARPGGTVLLAPACASLDMFANYQERGELFAKAVTEGAR